MNAQERNGAPAIGGVVDAVAAAIREHGANIRHGTYWVANCKGCNWQGGEPFGFESNCCEAHSRHVAAVVFESLEEFGLALVDRTTLRLAANTLIQAASATRHAVEHASELVNAAGVSVVRGTTQ